MNVFLETIRNRRTIRRYTSEPVPREKIDAILNTAVWAASAHNRQPWRFCVIQTDAVKEQLASAMGTRLQRDLQADGVAEAIIQADVTRSYARITGAQVLILVCVSLVDMDIYPDPRRSHNEYIMAVQSVAMAGQNLLLASHAEGLGACWMCAPLFVPDVLKTTLDLPEDWQPQGLVTLGYPAEVKEKTRHPVERSILWR